MEKLISETPKVPVANFFETFSSFITVLQFFQHPLTNPHVALFGFDPKL
jgi:hypothetical protein